MGWFWGLACSCAFVLISVCAASEDGPVIEQREVTFDIDEMPDMIQPAEADMMQKEVDLGDLFEPIEFPDMMQREVTHPLSPDLLKALRERGGSRAADPAGSQVDVTMDLDADFTPRGRRPVFGPRSPGGPPSLRYPVQFPPGQPTPTNLQAICLHGDRRPRYPDGYFPPSGFGQLKRRAAAVNRAESWFSMCCKGNETQEQEVTLCCVRQAWEMSVLSLCEDDFSVKDRHYHCCKKRGSERLECFQTDAPNPGYQATEEVPVSPPLQPEPEPGFTFNPDICQRSKWSPSSVKGKKERKPHLPTPQNIDISFPPGRPTAGEIESLCRYRKLRPRYDLKCLPRKGYGWLARQSKTVNRVEKGFKRCCKGKGEVLACTDGKWREEMDRFCREEKEGKMNFPCCETAEGKERYDCFHARAPHPGYGVDQLAAPDAASHNASLGQLCETHKIIKKKFPVGFPIQNFVNQCCPLSSEQGTTCIQEKLLTMSRNLCSARKSSSPSVRQCCHTSSQDSSQCLSNLLMDAITKATNVPRLRKRKCPLS